ncbi:hypothetical protein PCS_01024 [Desulfocurvibacter africanus PCS]|uniref:Uncharacterized protein n=1 Tax=Desulfocurvibacter africanus PCS TaxID=1262666 RepID=M5Q3C3_DESAF|nr:hypothetical protein PCS_01024 [Desulfocurvibacter africanus PCS]
MRTCPPGQQPKPTARELGEDTALSQTLTRQGPFTDKGPLDPAIFLIAIQRPGAVTSACP